ncbi:hypothetical protein GQ472_01505 [archaeon]|nr:hypothetical protein [archaeon]
MNKNIISFDLLRFNIVVSILLVSVLMLGNTAFAVDNTDPVLTDVSILSDNADTSYAEAGNIIILMFAASETISTPTVTIDGNMIDDVTNIRGNIWSAAWLVPAGDADGEVEFTIDFSDNASNTGAQVTATTDGSGIIYDIIQPYCGDNTCDADEDCSTCASDCGICTSSSSRSYITTLQPYCGDSVCQPDESAYDPRDDTGCEADCGMLEYCGDNICQAEEDCNFCESDCGACSEDSDILNSTDSIDAEKTDENKTISEPGKTSALVDEETPQSLTGLMIANINDSKTVIEAILVFVCALLLVNHFYISKKKQQV